MMVVAGTIVGSFVGGLLVYLAYVVGGIGARRLKTDVYDIEIMRLQLAAGFLLLGCLPAVVILAVVML